MYKFHKVSEEQFKKDCVVLHHWGHAAADSAEIIMPRRATMDSAGYDIFSPISFVLHPGKTIDIPTGLKAELPTGTFLMIVPRSGLGFRHQICLANTVGIIDADYYNNPENEGHIIVKLVNRGETDCIIRAGQAFCQGIILDYLITDDDYPGKEVRSGGFGSTDKESA